MNFECINISEAITLMDDKANIVDIRDNISFQTSHIDGAVNLNNDNIDSYIAQVDKSTPLIVCCYHGNSSKNAAAFLASQGFNKVYSLNGGFSQWSAMYPDRCSAS